MNEHGPRFETPDLNRDAREAAAGLSAYVEEWTTILSTAEPPDVTGRSRAPSRIPDGVVLALLVAVLFLALAASAFPTLPPR